MNYQNYQHYKLPITMNPLQYGKLIAKYSNKFILQINRTNLVSITQDNYQNHVKLFREGEFMFEFIDNKINESEFTRNLNNKKFIFKNNELISTEVVINRKEMINYSDTNSIINKNIRNLNSTTILKNLTEI